MARMEGSLWNAAGTRHQLVSLKIAAALLLHAEPRKLGHVIQAPCNVIFSNDFTLQPDIFYVGNHRSALLESGSMRGSPDLVIEIARNARDCDTVSKRKIYLRFEVRECWIADLEKETVEVLLWSEWGYASAGVYGKSGRLSSPSLPGLDLPLRRVFTA